MNKFRIIFFKLKNPEEAMYIDVHHELIASAKVVKLGKEINPNFQIGNTIAMSPIYPLTAKPNDQLLANQAMHFNYMFCDVQCRGHYPNYVIKYFENKNINIRLTDEDKEILSNGTVD
ncbi:MAG: family 1 glycosylhydrolase [Mycoplasma sp.]